MLSIDDALDALEAHYDAAISALREDIVTFAENGTVPAASAREGRYTYPRLLLHYDGSESTSAESRAFGRLGKRLLAQAGMSAKLRMRLYQVYVISVLV